MRSPSVAQEVLLFNQRESAIAQANLLDAMRVAATQFRAYEHGVNETLAATADNFRALLGSLHVGVERVHHSIEFLVDTHDLVLSHMSVLQAVVFYGTALVVLWLLTAFPRTHAARLPALALLAAALAAESRWGPACHWDRFHSSIAASDGWLCWGHATLLAPLAGGDPRWGLRCATAGLAAILLLLTSARWRDPATSTLLALHGLHVRIEELRELLLLAASRGDPASHGAPTTAPPSPAAEPHDAPVPKHDEGTGRSEATLTVQPGPLARAVRASSRRKRFGAE